MFMVHIKLIKEKNYSLLQHADLLSSDLLIDLFKLDQISEILNKHRTFGLSHGEIITGVWFNFA